MKRKLTIEEVSQIRQQCEYGRRPAIIAKEFKISRHTVWKIAHGARKGTYDTKAK